MSDFEKALAKFVSAVFTFVLLGWLLGLGLRLAGIR